MSNINSIYFLFRIAFLSICILPFFKITQLSAEVKIMKIYQKYHFDTFCGTVKDYLSEVNLAFENFISCSVHASSNYIEKKNYLPEKKYVFFMNVKEIVNKTMNDKYAFFYLAMDEEGFTGLSKTILDNSTPGLQADYDIQCSCIKEICNRIGARLLKFIDTKELIFDIGTPILLPVKHISPEICSIDSDDNIKCWPVTFFSLDFEINGNTIEFGSTVLERPDQYYKKATEKIIGELKGKYIANEVKEITAQELPQTFDTHILLNLKFGGEFIVSVASNNVFNYSQIFNTKSGLEHVVQYISVKLKDMQVTENVEIKDHGYKIWNKQCKTKIYQISKERTLSSFAVTMTKCYKSI